MPDPDEFRGDVLPLIQGASAAELAELTGLSRHYCGAILRGERAPHPRWWKAMLDVSPSADAAVRDVVPGPRRA